MNVATDTCILINLLVVHRLDLLGSLPSYLFFVSPEVVQKVEYPDQQQELQQAIERNCLHETTIEGSSELQAFTRANEQLGRSESACIALAETRGWALGTDESKGPKWKRVIANSGLRILNTPGILLLAIRQKIITVEQADQFKSTLEQNRFKMGFGSFSEFVGI